ncbi:hypothetical protein SAMN05216297_107241 [Flavobacterium phragmitis]|uniref:Uncharacterized protein n=1 Tax=Flavobacterium phragmitis TaxID=739143 RepID=A0A1I1S4X6_9FLAO|nr:hypothetical protein SAMN05216297_107241 [Flavobacterium phragmitis]
MIFNSCKDEKSYSLNSTNESDYHKEQTFKFVLTLSKIQWFIYDF